MESVEFDDLPESCISEILDKCAPKDLARFQCASRSCLARGRDPLLYVVKLKEFGIRVGGSWRGDYQQVIRVYRDAVDASKEELLPFRGLMTDGGLQGGEDQVIRGSSFHRLTHWVDNMFSHIMWKHYCSEILERDVRCMGVEASLVNSTKVSFGQAVSEENSRSIVFDENLLWGMTNGGRGLDGDDDLEGDTNHESDGEPGMLSDFCSVPVTRTVMIGRMGDISCPVASGVVFLGDFDHQDLDEGWNSEENALGVYSKVQTSVVNALSKCQDIPSLINAWEAGEIPKPVLVTWGVNGEWVEFERDLDCCMHPAVWFRFYTKSEFSQGNDFFDTEAEIHRRHRLAVRCGSNEIDCRSMHPSSVTPPPESPAELSPVTALRLAPWNQRMMFRRTTSRLIDGRELLEIPLCKPCAGNMVGAVLINCENFMEETWMAGGPNIDINFIYLVGTHVLVPSDR
ncbi:hypothetical protein BSKO_03141 [Bryopsis sp. KO-2023]|nr:hypothetical protein BSKO_03141 [Bryopsis sp. KO-2023]